MTECANAICAGLKSRLATPRIRFRAAGRKCAGCPKTVFLRFAHFTLADYFPTLSVIFFKRQNFRKNTVKNETFLKITQNNQKLAEDCQNHPKSITFPSFFPNFSLLLLKFSSYLLEILSFLCEIYSKSPKIPLKSSKFIEKSQNFSKFSRIFAKFIDTMRLNRYN